MKLVESVKKTSSHTQFLYKHKVKSYSLYFRVVALNEERARKKAFAAVHDLYKSLKTEWFGLKTLEDVSNKYGLEVWPELSKSFQKAEKDGEGIYFPWLRGGDGERVISRGDNGELLVDGKAPAIPSIGLASDELLVDRVQIQNLPGENLADQKEQV